MFLVFSCSRLRSIHWSRMLSWEWRCSWSSADRRCSNYIWVINNFITHWGATCIRGLTVVLTFRKQCYIVMSYIMGFTTHCKVVIYIGTTLFMRDWLTNYCFNILNTDGIHLPGNITNRSMDLYDRFRYDIFSFNPCDLSKTTRRSHLISRNFLIEVVCLDMIISPTLRKYLECAIPRSPLATLHPVKYLVRDQSVRIWLRLFKQSGALSLPFHFLSNMLATAQWLLTGPTRVEWLRINHSSPNEYMADPAFVDILRTICWNIKHPSSLHRRPITVGSWKASRVSRQMDRKIVEVKSHISVNHKK